MRDSSLDDFLSDPDEESEGEETDASERETADDLDPREPAPGPDDDIESEPDTDTDTDTDEAREGGEEGPPSTAEVEPARSTYAWSPDGVACATCGERVEERWESESGLVCVECKEW